MNRNLGRRPRSFNQAVPHYSSLRMARRGAAPPPIPAALNYLGKMPADLGMMLNGPTPDQPSYPALGDCTCAAVYHAMQVWSFNAAGAIETEADNYVLRLYEAACGYVLGDPSTDNGGNEQDVLTYWLKHGAPVPPGGDRDLNNLIAFVEIDPRNIQDVKRAIAEAGVVYLGINIPEAWTEAPIGSVWDVDGGPIAGGHAIIAAGYDPEHIYVVSWGSIWQMTWAAFSEVCDESYMLLDRLWLNASDVTPLGMTLPQLESAMQSLKAGG